jgi:DNA gyrase subunit A
MAPDTLPESVALHEATRQRYLTYALSVITSRALPDVRDGLKPVQRRILYAMYNNLHLTPDARYRKSAAVVGEVMAKYHPHGDSSIYEALVRMAQPFSLRHPLIDGQGNFGSLDGDNAAAMRYTECRLRPIAVDLLSEIKQRTVAFRPNYDGQHAEPVVLPAQFPQLLVNGAEGIAVGMATKIPPHNLVEVVDAALLLIERWAQEVTTADLLERVQGPDFPTGGTLVASPRELLDLYENGQGSVKVRAKWSTEKLGRRNAIIIHEIPYGVNKSTLVARIGELVGDRKLPQVTDVRDESTDIVRIVLELRQDGDEAAAMAWLYKHTALQISFAANLTCLIPAIGGEEDAPPTPARVGLVEMLRHWLRFRLETVRKRLQFQLEQLRERIHVLDGFAIVFDALDEAIRIIRASEGRRDATDKLMKRFGLDEVQTDAILELRLHQLARLAIDLIREELAEKRAEAARLQAILAEDRRLWLEVRRELRDIKKAHGEPRRTEILGAELDTAYNEDDYIVAEDAWVIVTRDGWVKRQGSFSGFERQRVREGDTVGWVGKASTRATVTFFTDQGGAYALRVDELAATAGHGEPVQRHFSFGDGEKLVGLAIHHPSCLPRVRETLLAAGTDEAPAPPHGVAITRQGRVLRFPLVTHKEPSNKNGRRFARLDEVNDGVVAVHLSDGEEQLCIATTLGRALCYPLTEVPVVKAAGKGVAAIKLDEGDTVFAAELSVLPEEGPVVLTAIGKAEVISPARFAGARAAKGKALVKAGRLHSWRVNPIRLEPREKPRAERNDGEE